MNVEGGWCEGGKGCVGEEWARSDLRVMTKTREAVREERRGEREV